MDRDFVWECDYGVREPIKEALEELLEKQDATSLQMATLMVNSNPYQLEFFIVLSYKNPLENHIEEMIRILQGVGLRYRPDITFDELLEEMANRRFNSVTIVDKEDLELFFGNTNLFLFPEKKVLEQQGYNWYRNLGGKMPIFLSHSSMNKSEVEDFIPYLNGAGLPVWFDKVNIDYGESITMAIQKGIKDSAGVIFWITEDFLKSNWCMTEFRKFSNRYASKEDLLVIGIINADVQDISKVEFLFDDIKYLKRENQSLEEIAKEIIPSIKKFIEKYKKNESIS